MSNFALEKEQASMRADIDHLYQTVYQGNGSPSLVTQVAKLDSRIANLEEKLDTSFKSIDSEMSLKFKNITDVVTERFNHISYQITEEFERKKHTSAGIWSVKKGVFTALVAGICSLLSLVIAEYVKRL